MPVFCRHNRLLQNCTICAREQHFEARPVVSSSTPRASQPRERADRTGAERPPAERTARRSAARSTGSGAVRVRRLARGVDDGYGSRLVPGLKSSDDAGRLAQEIAFCAWRLSLMEKVAAGADIGEMSVPSQWREITAPGDVQVRTEIAIGHVLDGPRGLDPGDRGPALAGIEAAAARLGSIELLFTGEPSWTPERRFERLFERLGGVRGLSRDSRYELLTLLGRLGVYELRGDRLFLSGENEATWAAKRALGIGDPMLLERRAAELAQACAVPVESLDLALHNWGSGVRVGGGLAEDAEPEPGLLERTRDALGL